MWLQFATASEVFDAAGTFGAVRNSFCVGTVQFEYLDCKVFKHVFVDLLCTLAAEDILANSGHRNLRGMLLLALWLRSCADDTRLELCHCGAFAERNLGRPANISAGIPVVLMDDFFYSSVSSAATVSAQTRSCNLPSRGYS